MSTKFPTTADIIEAVYEKVGGSSKKEAAEIVESVLKQIKDTLICDDLPGAFDAPANPSGYQAPANPSGYQPDLTRWCTGIVLWRHMGTNQVKVTFHLPSPAVAEGPAATHTSMQVEAIWRRETTRGLPGSPASLRLTLGSPFAVEPGAGEPGWVPYSSQAVEGRRLVLASAETLAYVSVALRALLGAY